MIDRKRLLEMLQDMGAEGLRAVMALFLAEAQEILAALGTADQVAIRNLVHSLRGSAQALGCDELARLSEWYETGSGQGPPPVVGQAPSRILGDCLDESMRQMRAALPRIAAPP